MTSEGTQGSGGEMAAEVCIRDRGSTASDCSSPSSMENQNTQPRKRKGPTRKSSTGKWTEEDDEILMQAVKHYKGKNWKKIASFFTDRSDVQCLHRWQKVLDPRLIKGAWTKEEDETIMNLVKIHGPKKWALIASKMPGRIGKQCRERWHNHLNPAIKKCAWTREEETILIRAHSIYGNKWAEIAKFLPGRADNSIKNHWNCSLKKRLVSCEALGLLNESEENHELDLKCSSSAGEKSVELPIVPVENVNGSPCPTGSYTLSEEDSNNYRTPQDQSEKKTYPSKSSWHSPVASTSYRDPEVFLREAAKTFTNMPSIISRRRNKCFGSPHSVTPSVKMPLDSTPESVSSSLLQKPKALEVQPIKILFSSIASMVTPPLKLAEGSTPESVSSSLQQRVKVLEPHPIRMLFSSTASAVNPSLKKVEGSTPENVPSSLQQKTKALEAQPIRRLFSSSAVG